MGEIQVGLVTLDGKRVTKPDITDYDSEFGDFTMETMNMLLNFPLNRAVKAAKENRKYASLFLTLGVLAHALIVYTITTKFYWLIMSIWFIIQLLNTQNVPVPNTGYGQILPQSEPAPITVTVKAKTVTPKRQKKTTSSPKTTKTTKAPQNETPPKAKSKSAPKSKKLVLKT